ncbi:hypothetical protein HELRODRAFT_164275 [Helobdella robusta]|uniref:Uncharacterized protein n=1 Tax=Helobdella robusta TaxID=6412 RepID=T1EV70_HELRO|nr:hypothetical protein HELRODRAFT_164275 [Helobdella robusta]ESN94434.1 hypothetical protein HELRODRAFT_164275 [Helobdella robusta]
MSHLHLPSSFPRHKVSQIFGPPLKCDILYGRPQIDEKTMETNARSESLSVDDEDKDDVFDVIIKLRKELLASVEVAKRTKKRTYCQCCILIRQDRHDVDHISQVLIDYKHYVSKKLKEWPLYSNVVTDFSMALIEAVLKGFNTMEIPTYLQYAMKWATSDVIPIKIVQRSSMNFENRWVLRSALNFASDGEVVREVASAREQDIEIYEKRKGTSN